MTLVEFLLERIAEDEAVARAAIADDGGATEGFADQHAALIEPPSGVGIAQGGFGEAAARMIATYAVPARVLAECGAKRRIVEFLVTAVEEQDSADVISAYDDAVRALALPFADHPGYDEVWRP